MKKRVVLCFFILIVVCASFMHYFFSSVNKPKTYKESINVILKKESYAYLPTAAKEYIKQVYEETGEVLLTEKNKEENVPYLNPIYVRYLESGEKADAIPSPTIVDYVPNNNAGSGSFPSTFSLRDYNGKNFVTPTKNQGSEGLCWDFATNAQVESLLLKKNNKSYDSSAVILSEKQIDYATAGDAGMESENAIISLAKGICNRGALAEGGTFSCATSVMVNGLGIVDKSWDTKYRNKIKNNAPLDGSDIYDFNNSLYEVNSTIEFPYLDIIYESEDVRTSYLNSVKEAIMTYGGAYVASDVCYDTVNEYNGEDTMVVDVMEGGGCVSNAFHALQIIGWDDNFEYTVCKRAHGYIYPEECEELESETVSGTGVWILKNSWGDINSTVLLAYDSLGTEIDFVTDIGTKNWDNYYVLKPNANGLTATFEFSDMDFVAGEKLNKIKMRLGQANNYQFYIDVNGTGSYQSLGTITSTYSGYYYLDLSDMAYSINENTKFKVVQSSHSYVDSLNVYTSNESGDLLIKTYDVHYGSDNMFLSQDSYFDFSIYNNSKNVNTASLLTYKIKDSNNNYVNESGYDYSGNKIYANINATKLTIDSNYFSKGNYTIETYYNNQLYDTANFDIDTDLLTATGDGSSEDPWQIRTIQEFNAIRNNPGDSFILMADLDFDYATQNENGIFYNDGRGFIAIPSFNGYLNGNNHKIINLYSKSLENYDDYYRNSGGIFGEIEINNNCKFDKCGIENLQVVNPRIEGSFYTGGIANILNVNTSSKLVFENNAVIGGEIKGLYFPSYNIGGLIGGAFVYDSEHHESVALFKNLYNSAEIKGYKGYTYDEYLGGIFGALIGGEGPEVINCTVENVMNIGKITPGDYTDSYAGIANIDEFVRGNVIVRNAISINNPGTAVFGAEYGMMDDSSILFSNVYSDSSQTISDDLNDFSQYITTNNIKDNLTTMEIANENYNSWSNFSDNWFQYNTDGVKRIPVIKNVAYDYMTINNSTINIALGENFNVSSIVSNENNNLNIALETSCNYNLSVCSNTTDTSIVSINGTNIHGNKVGTTKVIIYNLVDGYINAINVNVSGNAILSFNANGAEGSMPSQEFVSGVSNQINSNTYSRTGYIFEGWNTQSDGNGQDYSDGDTITITENMTLYAMWSPISYTIRFDANGGVGSMANIEAIYDQSYPLSSNTFTKDKYRFTGWNTSPTGNGQSYSDGQIVENLATINNTEIVLYAMWEQEIDYSINNYEVDETKKYISKIMANTEVNSFTANFILGYGYGIDVDTKLVNKKSILYTGGKTRITHGLNIYKEYTNVVIGDINGDGLINSADLLRIRQHLLKTTTLKDAYYESSDINYDKLINSADLLRIRQHLLGSKPIA